MSGPILRRSLVIILLLTLTIFGLVACGREDAKLTPTATITATETPAYTLTPTYLPRGASLIVTPNAVEPGGNIEVLGAGFLPEEALTIELVGALQGNNVTLASEVITNSYGAFSAISPISSNCSTGVFTLRVSGSQGSLVTMPLVIVRESK
jgi:hypothetical protein